MTDKNYTPPEFSKDFFTCPHCHFHTRHEWFPLKYSEKHYDKGQEYQYVQLSGIAHISIGNNHGTDPTRCRLTPIADICRHDIDLRKTDLNFRKSLLWASKCEKCFRDCIWGKGNLIYPDVSIAPPPNDDLPKKALVNYKEAMSIFSRSPRAAAAMLRLAVQDICVHLGCEGKNMQMDIDYLIKEKKLSVHLVKSMDAVRIVGNEAIHPGKMDLQDDTQTVEVLFGIVNRITEKLITEPRLDEAFHNALPDSKKRKNIPKE